MENKNKVIVILLIIIVILLSILGVKAIKNDSNSKINISNSNNLITENKTENKIEDNISIDNNSYKPEKNVTLSLIMGAIDIIVILVVVPNLLRKYEIIPCTIIMTIYKFIIMIFTANALKLGFLGILISILFLIIYYYIFLWIINKVFLDLNPIIYFFAVIITNGIISFISKIILEMILVNFII